MIKKYKKNLLIIIILTFFYLNDINFFNKTTLKIMQPKLSVIMPVFNGEKYINYSLSSVLNQKMKDIEIIIIDDNSKDSSLKIIKNYMKNDKRIKLIENKENRKILFCKSLASLNSKGKYIIEIDQDDMFIGDKVFDIVYNESENKNVDLLHFKYIMGYNNSNVHKRFSFNKISFIDIIKQPKLKFSIFRENMIVLWGNLIKTDLYKKVIYNLWPIIINYKIIFQEDFLITFFMLIYAEKYERINNYFYFYFINKNQASISNKNNPEYYISVVFAGIIFYEYYFDYHSQDIQIMVDYVYALKKDFIKIKMNCSTLFNYLIGKILTNIQLSQEYKIKLINDFNISKYNNLYNYISENKISFFNNLSFDKIKYKKQLLKLSIIIVFTKYENIKKIINSICFQTLDYFEIILIYNDEVQKDFLLASNFIKSFHNIILINNEIKQGIVHSILKGVKIAKSEYLLVLDQNCFFLEKNVFQSIYKKTIDEDFDILEFNLYKILRSNYISLYKCRHYHSQFNLTKIKYNPTFNDIDIQNELLTNKLFKTKFFKNIIKSLDNNKKVENINIYYNEIFSFIIDSNKYKFKKSSKINIYINEIDCPKFKFNDFKTVKKNLINESIIYMDFIFHNSKDTYEEKQKVLNEFFNALSIIYNKFTNFSDLSLKLYKQFINCKYYSKVNKTLLNFYFNSLIK